MRTSIILLVLSLAAATARADSAVLRIDG